LHPRILRQSGTRVRSIVAILGGSTPFTAALVEALRDAHDDIRPCELRLFGRDAAALERMRRYAERRLTPLGWTASATASLDEAVDGATIVVNQIRFGGLSGRARDEDLAARFQLPADETLGPCGLSAALRIAPRIRELAAGLGRRCPDAWVLNLANPLSISTTLMIRAGAPARCVGLCELPFATVVEACRVTHTPAGEVEWDYAGLNHRGFVFSLRRGGEDLMARLPQMLGGETIFGVTGEEIREVGALPLKYFKLSTTACAASPAGRAAFLSDLKETVGRELDERSGPPPSLSMRNLSWYDGAVVPMIAAVFAGDGRRIVVNRLAEDGLVRELPVRIWRERLEAVAVAPPARVAPWLLRWSAHERALLEAVESPDLHRIERALELDPSVPAAKARAIAQAIWADHGN
jgi:6-phospho-beta-glucosidase